MELALFKKGQTTTVLTSEEAHKNITAQIDNYLNEDRFNYVITAENIPQVKKDNADINKTSKLMMEVSKDIITLETETVNKFKENIKDYKATLEAKRVERVTAIEVYENETKETLRELLNTYTRNTVGDTGLRLEFDTITTEDLVKLGNITAKGALAKSGKDGVDAKVQKCLQLQNRYDLRISNLKVVCYEQGLAEPLNESHIQGIVFEDNEDKYQESLKSLIISEIERFEKVKAKIAEDERKKAELEANANANKLLKIQLEEKYAPLIPAATKEELENIQRELVNYNSSILININTMVSNRINAIYFEEQQQQENEVAKIPTPPIVRQDGYDTPIEDSSVLININTEISKKVNAIYFEEQKKINEVAKIPTPPTEEQRSAKPNIQNPNQVKPSFTPPPQTRVIPVPENDIVEDITPREDGKKVVKVLAMFEFIVKDEIPSEKILQRAKEVIEDALKETKMFESFAGVDLV